MVNANNWFAGGLCQTLRQHHAAQDAADKAGTGRHGKGVYLIQSKSGLPQRSFDCGVKFLGMRACRNLGHDTAEGGVKRCLVCYNRGQDRAILANHRSRRIIAAGFDPEHGQRF